MSKACFSGSSSEAFPSAALIPPSAAPEWLRVGWIFETSATSAPASCASMAARMPAQPAPTTSTSCFASTGIGRYRIAQRSGRVTIAAVHDSFMCQDYGVEGRACFESIVIGWARGSTSWARACTNGISARRCCSACRRGALRPRRATASPRVAAIGRRSLARGEGLARPLRRSARQRRVASRPARARRTRSEPFAAPTRSRRSRPWRAGLAGLVNLASAVTPNIAWRNHLLLHVEPFEALKLSHAAAIPASMLLARRRRPYLWRRRQGALRLALVLLARADRARPAEGPRRGSRRRQRRARRSYSGSGGIRSVCDTTPTRSARAAARPAPRGGEPRCSAGSRCGSRRPRAQASRRSCARPATRSSGRSGRSTSTTSSAHLDEAIGVAGLMTLAWCAYVLLSGRSPSRACCPGVERSACGARPRAPARRRHARLLQAAARPALPLQPGPTGRSSATASRRACCSSRATRSVPGVGDSVAPPRAEPLRRDARPEVGGRSARARVCGRSGSSSGCDRCTWATRRSSRPGRSRSRAARSARSGSRSRGWRSRAIRAELVRARRSSATPSWPSSRR